MRYVRLALISLVAVACGGGMQQAGSFWQVPPEQFFGTVKTIGVAPFWIYNDPGEPRVADPAPVRALFDSLVAQQLRQAGYTVVWVPELREFAAAPDLKNYKGERAQEVLLGRLAAVHPNVDAFLQPELSIAKAVVAFDGRYHAHFRGVTQSLPPGNYSGPLPAFAFCARLWNPRGVILFHGDGGIEVANLAPKPFADQDRNLNSVRIALGPILQRPVGKPVT